MIVSFLFPPSFFLFVFRVLTESSDLFCLFLCLVNRADCGGGPPIVSANQCFWPNNNNDDDDDGDDNNDHHHHHDYNDGRRGSSGRSRSRQSDHRGGSYAINDGLLAASVVSSSSVTATAPAKTTLVESVLRAAASMLASLALGADVIVNNTPW